jgi:hypothetical protein
MFRIPQIAVSSASHSSPSRRLLEGLGQLYSVKFVRDQDLRADAYDAVLLFGATCEDAMRVGRKGLRCLAFLDGESPAVGSTGQRIRLGAGPYLHSSFRALVLPDTRLQHTYRLQKQSGDELVASRGDQALWVHRAGGPSTIDLVAMSPPEVSESQYLFEYFQQDNWIRLLPLLHFLRELSQWNLPSLRACFMFDDPNLHWRSYGYIKYQELVDHARKHNYHACFATVPIDSWYVHPETASLFRDNDALVSLLIHGNNHTYYELTHAARNDEGRQALAAQALRRIERLERLSALEVARIMAAPHGACDHLMGNILMRMGFEAACISRSSLMVRNPNTTWPISVGLNPAEFLGGGLPVIPRFNVQWDLQTHVRFAAFLGQPIIPVGHHDDVANGLDLLQTFADLINSLGNVQWMNMRGIAQTNFSGRREDDVLYVKMFSRRIRLRIPAGLGRLSCHRSWLTGNRGEGLTLLRSGSVPEVWDHYQGEFLQVSSGDEIVISSARSDVIDPRRIAVSRPSFWAVARRQLCEGRDRLRPIADRIGFG